MTCAFPGTGDRRIRVRYSKKPKKTCARFYFQGLYSTKQKKSFNFVKIKDLLYYNDSRNILILTIVKHAYLCIVCIYYYYSAVDRKLIDRFELFSNCIRKKKSRKIFESFFILWVRKWRYFKKWCTSKGFKFKLMSMKFVRNCGYIYVIDILIVMQYK